MFLSERHTHTHGLYILICLICTINGPLPSLHCLPPIILSYPLLNSALYPGCPGLSRAALWATLSLLLHKAVMPLSPPLFSGMVCLLSSPLLSSALLSSPLNPTPSLTTSSVADHLLCTALSLPGSTVDHAYLQPSFPPLIIPAVNSSRHSLEFFS